jgi:glycosyltransferase involved in cell wall biosynthesis
MENPFFSVVLPTRNRAKYLSFAVGSVLNQTFRDFELVISNNDSSDNTEEIVKALDDPRVRYVKTDKTLSMDEHWDFALGHARGQFITFLGDDDAHSKIYLESIKKVVDDNAAAEIISCKMADYYYGSSGDNKKNTYSESLVTPLFTNELYIRDSAQKIRDLFIDRGLSRGKITEKVEVPQLINTVYHRHVFDKIRENSEKVFPKLLSGDYYLAVVTLSFTGNYYFLDSPLSFHGISSASTTSHISSESKGKTLKETQPELAIFHKAPLEIFTPYNFTVDAVLLAKSNLGERLDHIDLDMTGYFAEMFHQLHALELKGIDVSEETGEYFSIVEKQDPQMRKELEELVLNKRTRLVNTLRKGIYKTGLHGPLSRLRRSATKPKQIVVEGKNNGFSNIIECAGVVDHDFLRKYASRQ